MLAIKLARMGKTKQPTFRLIVTDKARDPWSHAVEILGNYDPKSKAKTCVLKTDRIQYWLSVGAQPTPSVQNLLVNQGVIKDKKVKVSRGHKGETKPEEAKK